MVFLFRYAHVAASSAAALALALLPIGSLAHGDSPDEGTAEFQIATTVDSPPAENEAGFETDADPEVEEQSTRASTEGANVGEDAPDEAPETEEPAAEEEEEPDQAETRKNPVFPTPGTHRLAGADRYQTAALVSASAYPEGADVAIIASGSSFADALSAAPLASHLNAPILLTQRDKMPNYTQAELARLEPSQVIVVGLTSVLSQSIAANEACFVHAPKPVVSGKATVGSTLTTSAGSWSPTPTSLDFQWLRSGNAIAGATAPTYKLVKADEGKTISVRATARLSGFVTTTTTSTSTSLITDPASINTASSINVVVNKKRPLNPAGYVPSNLRMPVGIASPNGQPLRTEAATALEKMNVDARKAGLNLYLMSGYRSYGYQASLYSSYVKNYGQAWADSYSARAGHSEHQTGLAADIYDYNSCEGACFGGSRAGLWLRNNAYNYGFILRYDQGMRHVVGYEYEPWHFRYVGTAVSKDMHSKGINTLEQYYGLPAAPTY